MRFDVPLAILASSLAVAPASAGLARIRQERNGEAIHTGPSPLLGSSAPTRPAFIEAPLLKLPRRDNENLELVQPKTVIKPTAHTTPSPRASETPSQGCFPMGGAWIPQDGHINMSRDQWWCSSDRQYGFLGFSYPMSSPDCNSHYNSYETISNDMKAMKEQYGASLLRIYSPECRDESIWINLLQAARDNNMGLVLMIWWGFSSDQWAWTRSKGSLLNVLNSDEWKHLAPYLIHSVAFGSEPIGDGVGYGNFLGEYQYMKSQLEAFGIPIAISEDWDRDSLVTYTDGSKNMPNGLTSYGKQLIDTSDVLQLHIMPYYRPYRFKDAFTSDLWNYFYMMMKFMRDSTGNNRQIMITQTMWSSQYDGAWHLRGGDDTGIDRWNFEKYFNTLNKHCQDFKNLGVGWFWHTWSDGFEPYFGLMDGQGKPKMDFKPWGC